MSEPAAPTACELEILRILWAVGPARVRKVHQYLAQDDGAHFNTVQSHLRRMEVKGLVRHQEDGRAFVYTPTYGRQDMLRDFLSRVFDGSAREFFRVVLRLEEVSAQDLARLQAIVRQARQRKLKGRNRP